MTPVKGDNASLAADEISSAENGYSLRSVDLETVDETFFEEWQEFSADRPATPELQDPAWLRWYYKGQPNVARHEKNDITVYALRAKGRLCGVAPFIRRNWPLYWQLGELTLAKFPPRRLRLIGGALDFPEDPAAYDLLFRELASRTPDFDTPVYLDGVPLDSFLWKYLQDSPTIRNRFLLYQPEPATPHLLVRITGSFEEYMGKFSGKHRKNINREIKKLKEGALGEFQFVRYELPEEVPTFLEHAVELSKKTYQWILLHRGLDDPNLLRHRLPLLAKQGWLRCYLLFCGGKACAFLLGYQCHGKFLFFEIGFDPAFASYSVGTVMNFLAVEDLFNHNRPEVMDLGTFDRYKEVLSTERYLQSSVFLFPRSARARLLRASHYGFLLTNRGISSVLDRFNLKTKVRKWLRVVARVPAALGLGWRGWSG
jgi:Acetyltransferase (GNAT) domain